MTENDKKALAFFKHSEGKALRYSGIAFALYPNEKDIRSPQGMALAGGKIVARLTKMGLIKKELIYGDGFKVKVVCGQINK